MSSVVSKFPALLYAVVDVAEPVQSEQPVLNWPDTILVELSEQDKLKELEFGRYVVRLHAADESQAMKIARLMRSTFQQSVRPSTSASLSIGVVLYKAESGVQSALLQAKKLALKDQDKRGNKIIFYNAANGKCFS